MKITVGTDSANWFKRELKLRDGDAVRFFARYGGESNEQPGFSLGVSVERPQNVAASQHSSGIHFFVRDEDLWFFDGFDLIVDYDEINDDIAYVLGPSRGIRGSDPGTSSMMYLVVH